MAYDIAAAIKYLDEHAEKGSTSHCARYVRLALEAGGLDTDGAPVPAKDYGPFLKLKNFVPVELSNDPVTGDVVVIQPYKGGSVYGHIAMYDGDIWVSDFKQTDMWGGPGYRKATPEYQVFRYKKLP